MRIDAVIFDVDGLMADSEPLHRSAWRELGRRNEFPTFDRDYEENLGKRVIDNFRRQYGQGRFEQPPEVLLVQYHDILINLIREKLQPKIGLGEILDLVREQGLRCGTASSGDRIYIDVVLDVLKIRHHFQAVATGEEVAEGKPSPELYLLAAARLGVGPAGCVALEDSPSGVRAAKAAGMRCIAVPEGKKLIEEADSVCESLFAARDVLQQWAGG